MSWSGGLARPRVLGAAAVALATVGGGVVFIAAQRHPDVVVGAPPKSVQQPSSTFVIPTEPTTGTVPPATAPPATPAAPRVTEPYAAQRKSGGVFEANGRPPVEPIPFTSSLPVPDGLVWILAVGSDARPGNPLLRSNADSIHLLAVNPQTHHGVALGFPRDSWVDIPGHGPHKLNAAMAFGGPDLLAQTIHGITGLPINLWVVVGFPGLRDLVNDLDGVDVYVNQLMSDHDSGAYFAPGWHHMDGGQALAYSRDRHDVPDGDFTRSAHQAQVMLAALYKMRAVVGDDGGIAQWVEFLYRHVEIQAPMDQVRILGALARRADPADISNVVVPGHVGKAGSQSVVYLDGPASAAVFDDLRPDATIGSAPPPTTAPPATTTPPPTEPATTAPSTTLLPFG